MIAEGLTYTGALSLINKLKQAGIDANITVGRVRVIPDDGQMDIAREICTEAGAAITMGGMSTTAGTALIGAAQATGRKIKIEGNQ